MRAQHTFVLGAILGSVAAVGLLKASETQFDPVKVSPGLYTVRFENDRVRVLEYRLGPGQKEPMHSHPPGVIYTFAEASFRSISPDGKVAESHGKAGDLYWRDATTHSAENVGSTEAHALNIELKPCS